LIRSLDIEYGVCVQYCIEILSLKYIASNFVQEVMWWKWIFVESFFSPWLLHYYNYIW